jgi:hypothetical protein
MSIQDDSTATFTKYIARLNESLAQLATVKPMSISEIYALAALMGLHLSSSARHERAYRDLMTFIDEGNALTLEEVLKVGLKYSRDRPSTANAFSAVRAADPVCTRACPLCCSRGRSPHPSSRNSSRAGSRHGSPRSGHRAFRVVHDHEYWNQLGLDEVYHTYAAVLEVNDINHHYACTLLESFGNLYVFHAPPWVQLLYECDSCCATTLQIVPTPLVHQLLLVFSSSISRVHALSQCRHKASFDETCHGPCSGSCDGRLVYSTCNTRALI